MGEKLNIVTPKWFTLKVKPPKVKMKRNFTTYKITKEPVYTKRPDKVDIEISEKLPGKQKPKISSLDVNIPAYTKDKLSVHSLEMYEESHHPIIKLYNQYTPKKKTSKNSER